MKFIILLIVLIFFAMGIYAFGLFIYLALFALGIYAVGLLIYTARLVNRLLANEGLRFKLEIFCGGLAPSDFTPKRIRKRLKGIEKDIKAGKNKELYDKYRGKPFTRKK